MPQPLVPIPFTAVVPAAGLGTRFLPATKTVPKELLPVVDTPGIELVAAEAAEAGGGRLVIITSKGKDGVVAHFVEDLVLEGTLEARGKHLMLEKVRRASALIKVESVVQAEPLGLGHAVSCVEHVLLPDDLVLPTGVLETMSKVRAKRGGSVLCAIEVPSDEISAYGVFDVETVPDAANPNVLRVKGMVEKPKASDAPSPYAAAGRYVLDRAIFTAPAHPFWGGAALIAGDGSLIGVGSLHVQHSNGRELRRDVNMIVPIDLLPPILEDLLTLGRPNRPPRPWLGLYATEVDDAIVVAGLSERGPAVKTGLRPGDRILAVRDEPVSSLASFWRRVWASGPAGSEVVLQVVRDNDTMRVRIPSADRSRLLKAPLLH